MMVVQRKPKHFELEQGQSYAVKITKTVEIEIAGHTLKAVAHDQMSFSEGSVKISLGMLADRLSKAYEKLMEKIFNSRGGGLIDLIQKVRHDPFPGDPLPWEYDDHTWDEGYTGRYEITWVDPTKIESTTDIDFKACTSSYTWGNNTGGSK